jgi:hypothetical protein
MMKTSLVNTFLVVSHITLEAIMVVKKASDRDSPLRQGAGKSSWILPISFR